jgi:MFS family permease
LARGADALSAEDERAVAAGYADAGARGEYRRMALACLLVSFMNAHSTLLAVVFSRAGHDLHAIGILLSVYAIPVLTLTFLSGAVAGRLGVLRTTQLAMALLILGFVSLQVTHGDFYGAMASRLVQGMGQGLFLSAVITYAQSRLSQARFLYLLGVFAAMMPLAQAVAPPFGGFILNTYGDGFFFLLGAAPALLGLALTFGLRELASAPQTRLGDIFAAARKGTYAPLWGVFVNGALFGFTTAYLAAAMEARAIPLAAFFTASTFSMFASRFLAMRRFERADRRALVAAGLGLMSLGFVLMAASGVSWPVVIAGVTFGTGYSLVYPVLSAWMSEGRAPDARAGPQALLNTAFNIGLFVMPYPMSLVIETWGYTTAMLGLAALGALTAAQFAAMKFRARPSLGAAP